jgi:hypothetical protein
LKEIDCAMVAMTTKQRRCGLEAKEANARTEQAKHAAEDEAPVVAMQQRRVVATSATESVGGCRRRKRDSNGSKQQLSFEGQARVPSGIHGRPAATTAPAGAHLPPPSFVVVPPTCLLRVPPCGVAFVSCRLGRLCARSHSSSSSKPRQGKAKEGQRRRTPEKRQSERVAVIPRWLGGYLTPVSAAACFPRRCGMLGLPSKQTGTKGHAGNRHSRATREHWR